MSSPEALALLATLRLEDGRRWGQVALPWQLDDVQALIDRDGPRRHWWSRPRGASKTSDAAAAMLALLVTEAPPLSRSYAFASDRDQAGLVLDALAGYVARAGSALGDVVEVGASAVTVRATGARLVVEAADAASSFGLRPWAVVVDELAQWPATPNHRRLWSSITSAMPKVRDSRMLVITSPSSPTSWAHEVFATAEASDQWRVSTVPGPSPWWTSADLDAVRATVTPAEYRRLILCEWAEADDNLTTAADIAALVEHPGPLEPRPGVRYQLALDLGLRNDATVLAVGHLEHRAGRGRTVVVDRVLRWRGSRARPVELGDVEEAVMAAHRRYNRAPLRTDPWQAAQLSERLRGAGVRVEDFTFSASSVDHLARTLYGLIRDRALVLPDDPHLLAELSSVRLVETRPGVIRLDHRAGEHDDQAVSVALLATALLQRPQRAPARVRTAARSNLGPPPAVVGGRLVTTAASRQSRPWTT